MHISRTMILTVWQKSRVLTSHAYKMSSAKTVSWTETLSAWVDITFMMDYRHQRCTSCLFEFVGPVWAILLGGQLVRDKCVRDLSCALNDIIWFSCNNSGNQRCQGKTVAMVKAYASGAEAKFEAVLKMFFAEKSILFQPCSCLVRDNRARQHAAANLSQPSAFPDRATPRLLVNMSYTNRIAHETSHPHSRYLWNGVRASRVTWNHHMNPGLHVRMQLFHLSSHLERASQSREQAGVSLPPPNAIPKCFNIYCC